MPAIKGSASVADDRARQKVIKSTKFPPHFTQKVDLSRVNRPVLAQWIEQYVTRILGFEDEIVQNTVVNVFLPEPLEDGPPPEVDPRLAQVDVSGFLGELESKEFASELWELMLDAQESPMGIPKRLLEEKKRELQAQKQEVQPEPRQLPPHPRGREEHPRHSTERARTVSPVRDERRSTPLERPRDRGYDDYGRLSRGEHPSRRARSNDRYPARYHRRDNDHRRYDDREYYRQREYNDDRRSGYDDRRERYHDDAADLAYGDRGNERWERRSRSRSRSRDRHYRRRAQSYSSSSQSSSSGSVSSSSTGSSRGH